MTREERTEFIEAVDVVCLNCVCGNDEVCKDCPVRKTVDRLVNEEDNNAEK